VKLWLIEQDVNNDYDTYDSAVVAAETEEEARLTHPSGRQWDGNDTEACTWCEAGFVNVEYIGEAKPNLPKGVVVASFNAG
jgi:hypothetical protein